MAIARVNSDLQSQALIDYINSISDSAGYDKVAILFDKDPDGQTSAKLMKEILIRSGRRVEIVRALRHDEQRPDQELLEEIARKEITHIITLDLPIGEKREYWTAFSERRKLAIIDHHRTGKHGEESEGEDSITDLLRRTDITYVNPHFMPTGDTSEFVADYEGDPSRWNTSKLIWDLTNAGREIVTESAGIEGIEDLDWICAIGVIADYGFRKWSNFLRGVYERYAYSTDGSEPKVDFSGSFSLSRTIYNSGLGRIVKLIGLVNKDNDPNAVQKIYELIDSNAIALAKKPEPLLNLMLVRIPELEVIEREADRYIPQVLPTTDCPDLMLLDLPEGSRDLRNSVSGIVAAQNPDRYVLVTRRESGKVKLSLRCEILGFEPELMDETGRQKHEQKMMQYRSCEELIGTVASKFGGGGGGHIAAAGGRVPEARYVEFLSELKREINSERLILN